jgi:hypothetical protein
MYVHEASRRHTPIKSNTSTVTASVTVTAQVLRWKKCGSGMMQCAHARAKLREAGAMGTAWFWLESRAVIDSAAPARNNQQKIDFVERRKRKLLVYLAPVSAKQ